MPNLPANHLDDSDSSCPEKISGGERYFVVGLSGGISSAQAGERLKISIDLLRYVDFLKDGGHLVIFDAQNLGYEMADDRAFDQALEEMEVRLKGVSASQGGKVDVTRASSVISGEREKFDFLVSEIKQILREDGFVQEKIWKIVPPSAKGNDLNYLNFSDVPADRVENAYSLMEYEVLHLAFIFTNDGTKIAHGRSEERSAQLIKHLKNSYGERLGCSAWKGEVQVGKVESPRIFADKYPSPYGLAGFNGGREPGVEQAGSLPVSSNVSHIHRVIMNVLSRGGEESLRRYLSTLPGSKDFYNKLDFSNPKAVYLTTSLLINKCIWPIESAELAVAKERFDRDGTGDFGKRIEEKVAELEETLKLSPQLKVVIEDLMPVFLRKPGDGSEEKLRWFIEGLWLGGVTLHLANEYERTVMMEVLEMAVGLYSFFDPKWKNVSYDPWWIEVLDFADEFCSERLDNPDFAGEGMVSTKERKAELIEPLRQIAKVLSLNGDFGDNLGLLHRRIDSMGTENYRPISSQSRNVVLKRVILPYLNEKRKSTGRPSCIENVNFEDVFGGDDLASKVIAIRFFREFVAEKTRDIRKGSCDRGVFDDEIALQHLCLILIGFEKEFRRELVYSLPLHMVFPFCPEVTTEDVKNIAHVLGDEGVLYDDA